MSLGKAVQIKPLKTALVCGAAGFIGHHLVTRLKSEGYWVRGVGRSRSSFLESKADEFFTLDLRDFDSCLKILQLPFGHFDEVYQLAAEMGGIGFIESSECEILRNSSLINLNVLHAAVRQGAKRYFFASSACVYRDMAVGEIGLTEKDAYPALPHNEYGWEKLFSERVAFAYTQNYDIDVRIGRLQTVYGPLSPWTGGKEKAPCALCRKAASTPDGGTIEVWGDGTAVRSFLYIDDLIEAIRVLMKSNICRPVNIGSNKYVSIKELAELAIACSGKELSIQYASGPVGVQSRNFSNELLGRLGWAPQVQLKEGMQATYDWVANQVKHAAATQYERLANE